MTKQSLKVQSLHYFAALLLGLLLLFFLKPGEHLTAVGVRVIAVMIPMLYLWLTANTHWTCLLALALLVTTGAMSANEVWAGSLGSFVVMTVLAYMILNVCLKETGVIDRIAVWFITRPFVRGRPYLFMAMFFASNLLIGMFMENLTLAIIYIGITEGIARHLKLEKGDSMYTVLFTGVMWGNVLVACCSPVAHVLPSDRSRVRYCRRHPLRQHPLTAVFRPGAYHHAQHMESESGFRSGRVPPVRRPRYRTGLGLDRLICGKHMTAGSRYGSAAGRPGGPWAGVEHPAEW